MKKIIIGLFCYILLSPISFAYAGIDVKIPRTEDRVSYSTGGYMLFEISSGDFFLIDTRTGRLWRFIGDISNPGHFEPIKYEISNNVFSILPEKETTNQFPGRFAFEKIKEKFSSGFFILDTVAGRLWRLQDSADPIKVILVPRKD